MEYVTIEKLSLIIRTNLYKIPHDIDIVVGVPRSGMLAANMIALYLNKRLTDLDSFVEGRIYNCGDRGKYVANNVIKKVLIVDDSICTGSALKKTKGKIQSINTVYEYIYCCPIATTNGAACIDLAFKIIDGPRIFEWNLFHHGFLENSCLDIDGVLCVDPEYDDDGEKYIEFLKTAQPLFTPTCKIGTLISCRLEKYRKYTEEWLYNNHIQYDKLVLLDKSSKAERIKWGKHGEYKAAYYKQSNCILFVESSKIQAQVIAQETLKPVICIETNSLVLPQPTRRECLKNYISKRFPKITYLLVGSYRKIKYGRFY